MATKHISDLQVVLAFLVARELRDGPKPEWPYEILQRVTGQCEKVCYRAMERADRRGLVEYGVSLRSGWVTDKGKDLVRASCIERGVPVPAELDEQETPHRSLVNFAKTPKGTLLGSASNPFLLAFDP